MDKPLLALPYRGPSHSIAVLERIAQRETLLMGVPWTDLPISRRNMLLNWAANILDEVLQHFRAEPVRAGLRICHSNGVQSFGDLDLIESWVRGHYYDCLDQLERARSYRNSLAGRDR